MQVTEELHPQSAHIYPEYHYANVVSDMDLHKNYMNQGMIVIVRIL